jgi:hypothetical protein
MAVDWLAFSGFTAAFVEFDSSPLGGSSQKAIDIGMAAGSTSNTTRPRESRIGLKGFFITAILLVKRTED